MTLLINAYSTRRTPPEPAFPHELNGRRDRSDPELPEHLQGFVGYILSRGDGQMTQTLYHVMRHIQRVQQHFSMNVEEDTLDEFGEWAWQANAISFLPDGSVRDPAGRTL